MSYVHCQLKKKIFGGVSLVFNVILLQFLCQCHIIRWMYRLGSFMCIKVPHEPPKLTKLHIVFMKASNFVQIAKKKKKHHKKRPQDYRVSFHKVQRDWTGRVNYYSAVHVMLLINEESSRMHTSSIGLYFAHHNFVAVRLTSLKLDPRFLHFSYDSESCHLSHIAWYSNNTGIPPQRHSNNNSLVLYQYLKFPHSSC